MEFFIDNDSVIIRKYNPSCIFCNSVDNIKEYKGQPICGACLEEIKKT